MKAGRASKTAEHNTLFRALEDTRRGRRFDEPVAARLLSPPFRAVVVAARVPGVGAAVGRVIDARWPGVRTSVVARTHLIDEAIENVVGRVDQVVFLGAGYDTRAYRLECLHGVTVFEVDHPDTQRVKRERLRAAGVSTQSVRYVATDLLDGDLDAALATAGFDRTATTLYVWEGVTNYLDASSVEATLRWCASTAPRSILIFTYIDRRVLDEPGAYVGAERVFSTLRRADERMTFGIAPARLEAYLRSLGLVLVSDDGAADYRSRYYGAAAERMRGHEFYRVAIAEVAGAGY